MKNIILGVLIGFGMATAVAMAEQPTEPHRGMMGGMMQGMQGMMGHPNPGEQSHEKMQSMKDMMARDMCNHMMSSASRPKHEQSSE
jgi:hypothetical protein